jgi:ribose/xylose/arabinose/galactoside ABC-type transport system permease subunit
MSARTLAPVAAALDGRVIYLLLVALVTGAAVSVPAFRTADNVANVLTQAAALGLVAIGQTFVILGGLIDLSVGQLLGLVVVLACALMDGHSERTLAALTLAAGAGAGIGWLNGRLFNLLRVHSLILTFGTASILQGAIFAYTDRSVGAASPEVLWLANGRIGGIPAALIVLALAAAAAHLVLTRTRFGQHLRAVGGHVESARRAGVDIARVQRLAFVLSGLGAGLGGILVAGRLGSGYPNAGQAFELDSIVAVVLGGTSLAGGRGSIAGTVAAVLLLALASNVLNLLEVPTFMQTITKGCIVVVAVLLGQRAAGARR